MDQSQILDNGIDSYFQSENKKYQITNVVSGNRTLNDFNQQNTLKQNFCGKMQNNYKIPSGGSETTTSIGKDFIIMNCDSSNSFIEENIVQPIKKIKGSHVVSKLKNPSNTQFSQKKKPEKVGKGLRHFSMKVCEKVKEKGATTYNEVADELVAEEVQNQTFDSPNCDQKNIRRRVYDALNVLMAMNIISKDKKEIRWVGLPTNSLEQLTTLEKENEIRRKRIQTKHQQLRELLLQQVSFKNLIERNRDAENKGIIPLPNSSIELPFIIVNTHKSTKIDCSVTSDKSEYIFKFDDNFEMHDDAEVLKRMGLLLGLDKGSCSYEDIERAKLMVPKNFEKYIETYGGQQDGGELYDNDEKFQYDDADNISNDSQIFSNDSQMYSQIISDQISEINDKDYCSDSDIE